MKSVFAWSATLLVTLPVVVAAQNVGSAIRSRNKEGAIGMHGMESDHTPIPKHLAPNSQSTLVHYVMKGDEHEHVESYLPFFNTAGSRFKGTLPPHLRRNLRREGETYNDRERAQQASDRNRLRPRHDVGSVQEKRSQEDRTEA